MEAIPQEGDHQTPQEGGGWDDGSNNPFHPNFRPDSRQSGASQFGEGIPYGLPSSQSSYRNLPKLPSISLASIKWDGNFSTLANYLHNFHRKYAVYGNDASLSLFIDCMGKKHYRALQSCRTLEEAISQMSRWCSDSAVHTTKLVRKMEAIPFAKSLLDDKNITIQLITLVEECLDINPSFSVSIPEAQVYAAKFHHPTLYERYVNSLKEAAATSRDIYGKGNYAVCWLHLLRNTLKWLDDRLSASEIHDISRSTRTLTLNSTGVTENSPGTPPAGHGKGRSKIRGNGRVKSNKDNPQKHSSDAKCGVCHKLGHSNLLFCEKFLTYVPHKTKKWGPLPKAACAVCLNTDTLINPPTCHRQNPGYMCPISKKNNVICECVDTHDALQNHLHAHFNPAQGYNNVKIFNQGKGSTVNHNSMHCTISISQMTLNGCVVGKSSCPCELIEVPLPNGSIFCAELHYDGGAQHSLAAVNAHPIVLRKWISQEPITLSTLAGCSSELRQMCELKLCDGSTMEAVCVTSLEIRAVSLGTPKIWAKYASQWALPVSENRVYAQILVGADCPALHPHDVFVHGDISCNGTARLMKSRVTGRYLAWGFFDRNQPMVEVKMAHIKPRITIGPAVPTIASTSQAATTSSDIATLGAADSVSPANPELMIAIKKAISSLIDPALPPCARLPASAQPGVPRQKVTGPDTHNVYTVVSDPDWHDSATNQMTRPQTQVVNTHQVDALARPLGVADTSQEEYVEETNTKSPGTCPDQTDCEDEALISSSQNKVVTSPDYNCDTT